jgi:hypothetical protein
MKSKHREKTRLLGAAAIGGLAVVGGIAWFAPAFAAGPHQDAATVAVQAATQMPDLGPIVLTVLAAAFAVERVVELIWNYLEWALLNFGKWQPARLKGAAYLQFKSGTSVLLSAIFGVLLANFVSLGFFTALRPSAPGLLSGIASNLDAVISGLIIGVLAKPLHDLLELIAELKSFTANAAIRQREAAGAEMADGVLKLAQSEAQSMLDVPGMGPTRLSTGGFAEEEHNSDDSGAATERYIALLKNKTSL